MMPLAKLVLYYRSRLLEEVWCTESLSLFDQPSNWDRNERARNILYSDNNGMRLEEAEIETMKGRCRNTWAHNQHEDLDKLVPFNGMEKNVGRRRRWDRSL